MFKHTLTRLPLQGHQKLAPRKASHGYNATPTIWLSFLVIFLRTVDHFLFLQHYGQLPTYTIHSAYANSFPTNLASAFFHQDSSTTSNIYGEQYHHCSRAPHSTPLDALHEHFASVMSTPIDKLSYYTTTVKTHKTTQTDRHLPSLASRSQE